MKEKLTQLLQEGKDRIAAVRSEAELQEVKALLLGKQGSLTGLLKELPKLDAALRPEIFQRAAHRFVRQNSVQAGADDGIRILSQSRVHERNLLFKFVLSSCGTAFSCLALS